jgi:protein phosphatase
MELRIASATDRGRVREQNEDSVLADLPLVAVADGMGGHKAGEVASSQALEALAAWRDRIAGTSGVGAGELLREAFDEANRRVWERGQQDENLLGMGTTLTAGWIDGGTVTLAHVGDSRAYLLRDGELRQLTTDQNVAQDLVRRGRLSEDEAASSPHRHIILQAIGADPDGLDIEVSTADLKDGDRVVLATDGMFGMVRSADRIKDLLVEHTDPADACKALIDEANAAGGEDNITVVLIDVVSSDDSVIPPVAGAAPAITADRPVAPAPPDDAGGARRLARVARWPVVVGVLAFIVVAVGAFFVTRLGSDTLLVAERNGTVVVLRGKPGDSGERATGDVVTVFGSARLSRFPKTVREDLREGIPVASMSEARKVVADLPRLLGPQDTPEPSPSVSPGASSPAPTREALGVGVTRP